MTEELTIPLVTTDSETARKVALAVESAEELAPVTMLQTLDELLAHGEDHFGPLWIVDIDPDPMGILADLGRLLGQRPQVRCVVVCRSAVSDLMLEAMAAGARHLLAKDAIVKDLAPALRKLVPAGSEFMFGHGMVITVLAASGGCGVTTISVNLANELQLLTSRPVLLVDMDDCHGAAATYLGLKGNYGLAEVLAHGAETDPQLVRSSTVAFSENLHVLLSPVSVNFHAPSPLAWENVPSALAACRRGYAYTVVDAPHLRPDLAAMLAARSQLTLIIMQMTVQDIQYARNLRAALVQHGVLSSRVMLAVNRFQKRSPMISLEECRHALGENHLLFLRNDFRNALLGINYGRPLSESAPRSALRKDILQMAQQLIRVLAGPAREGEQR